MHQVTVASARRTALKVLARVRKDDAFSGPVLAAQLAADSLTPEDTALATRLVYGVLASQGTLDEALRRYARGSLEPRVADALRLAAFEMLFGRTPPYAAVDQGVEAVRGLRPQAAGLANAVLRRLAEVASDFPWGDPDTDRDALARFSAHPRWIVDVVLESLGQVAGRQMLDCGTEPAPVYVRLDPFGADSATTLRSLAEASPEVHPPDPDCFRLGRPAAAFRSAHDDRCWFAMDAAAQMAPHVCAPEPSVDILDVGAGRGNKTICLQSIAARCGGTATITALEIHEGKAAALRDRLDSASVPGVRTLVGDGTRLDSLFAPDAFDLVLLDAPCSGLGTLRRYPEKRWRLDEGTPARMAALQLEMLVSASCVVRPGGRVVYSTCSIDSRENEAVVRAFTGAFGGGEWTLEPLRQLIPAEWSAFRDVSGSFRSWPTSGGPDGHYVATLRRTA
ncbi:MAG: methyltransferase domain-containing protein [Coriobacteriia bacterium]|nr:methyltransferase domain-containing protein [Coriobacteriia bacterium]